MAPSDPPGTVLEVCLRVRQSGAIRVLVALVRMILDLWAAPPRCGYWESRGFFCSAPQDFGVLGVFYARFPPREACNSSISLNGLGVSFFGFYPQLCEFGGSCVQLPLTAHSARNSE